MNISLIHFTLSVDLFKTGIYAIITKIWSFKSRKILIPINFTKPDSNSSCNQRKRNCFTNLQVSNMFIAFL